VLSQQNVVALHELYNDVATGFEANAAACGCNGLHSQDGDAGVNGYKNVLPMTKLVTRKSSNRLGVDLSHFGCNLCAFIAQQLRSD
jgi:hypothetical protein